MLRRKVSIDTLSVTKEQFADFNLFINMLNGAYKETVGLKKNNAK